jgi:hypothetical protein
MGCSVNTTLTKKNTTSDVEVKEIKPKTFDNVPIYPDFEFVPEKSFIYESGEIKIGKLVFKGNASIDEVVNYYKATLPEEGWKPISISIFGKEANMTYTTSNRVLQVYVVKGFSETLLVIQVGPRGELTSSGK